MGVLAIIGAAAIVVGGLWVACSSLEAANERKSEEIRLARKRCRAEIRQREALLEGKAKAKTVMSRLKQLRAVAWAARKSGEAAYSKWCEIKAQVVELKEQTGAAFSRSAELKRQFLDYVRNQKRSVGMAYDPYRDAECLRRMDEICTLERFCHHVVDQKRLRQEAKKDVWKMMQKCNRQFSVAKEELWEYRDKRVYFVCGCCGRKYSMMVGELERRENFGEGMPIRCRSCENKHYLA